MNLDKLLKKAIEEKENKKSGNIDIQTFRLFLNFGTRVAIIYLLFIFLIGKYLAKALNYNNLYSLAIIIATIVNIYLLIDTIKKIKNKKN